jgi:hypothetical protein
MLVARLARSSRDRPVKSAAHGNALTAAKALPTAPRTSLALPNSPCPKRAGSARFAGEAERGTTQMNGARVVFPRGRTGSPRRSSRKRDPGGQPGRSR